MRVSLAHAFVAVSVAAGCGGSSPSGAADLAAGADMATPGDLEAMPSGGPELQAIVHPDHGIFELAWTNPPAGCDMIEVDRRINAGAYAPVETIAGTSTSYTDVDHNDSGTFCYRLQCQTAGGALPSNQQCVAQ